MNSTKKIQMTTIHESMMKITSEMLKLIIPAVTVIENKIDSYCAPLVIRTRFCFIIALIFKITVEENSNMSILHQTKTIALTSFYVPNVTII